MGSLRLASTKEQLHELQRSVSRAKGIGMDCEIISPAEALKIMPQLSPESLYGAIYLPRDGHLDPYGTTTGMARLVREMGCVVRTNTRVTGIKLTPDGAVSEVLTENGAIKCEHVVNATGLWGPRVAAMAGLHLPTTPVDHQHIALKAVPGNEFPHATPCLRDPDYLVYMREEAGGYLPEQLATEEILERIKPLADQIGATRKADFPKLMPLAIKELKGLADGKDIKETIEKFLGAN